MLVDEIGPEHGPKPSYRIACAVSHSVVPGELALFTSWFMGVAWARSNPHFADWM